MRGSKPAGSPGGKGNERERDITEHSSYLVGPYVIVPYGAAAQKLKREGHAGRNQVLDGWGRDEGMKGWRDEMNSGKKFDFFLSADQWK